MRPAQEFTLSLFKKNTVAEHLLRRLKEIGIRHLFGVPGDFSLGLLNATLDSDVRYIGCCNELNAAYAADGYARIRGAGALCTTFGAGELSAVNGIAGAFAEKVPVVMITGSPATINFRTQPLLHHTLGDYQIPQKIYEKICVASTRLHDAENAVSEIDRVLRACLSLQQPVYISIPSDLVAQDCPLAGPFIYAVSAPSDAKALAEAVQEAFAMLVKAQKPLLIGGIDLIRHGLQPEFADLVRISGFPFATMMLGKTVLSERHPQFIGLFEGERSSMAVLNRVRSSDCVIQLGALMCDFNTGGFTTGLDDAKTINASLLHVQIRHHHYDHVALGDFVRALAKELSSRSPRPVEIISPDRPKRLPEPSKPLSVDYFFERVSRFIKEGSIVVAETGVSLFSAAELPLPDGATFIGQAFYGSIGFTVGATLGASLAAPARPMVLFVGDGSFQVAAQELSTMIRNKLKPVIFLINNDGYTIERVIVDKPYNDIQPWSYHQLPSVFGGGLGLEARTEGDLEEALSKAENADGLVFIEVHTDRMDCPESLRSAGRMMAKTNHLD